MCYHNFFFLITLWAKTTILRIPLLVWAESPVAEFNSDAVFSEVGRNISLRGPNPSWAEPSVTPYRKRGNSPTPETEPVSWRRGCRLVPAPRPPPGSVVRGFATQRRLLPTCLREPTNSGDVSCWKSGCNAVLCGVSSPKNPRSFHGSSWYPLRKSDPFPSQ